MFCNKTMELKPSEIYYCQDSIANHFGKGCPHRNILIGQTLDDLCENRITPRSIPTISVTQRNGKWFTGDNRRLWVFKQAERLGKCDKIPVYDGGYIPPNKFTSLTGSNIRVRGSPGGYWYSRPSVLSQKPALIETGYRSPSRDSCMYNFGIVNGSGSFYANFDASRSASSLGHNSIDEFSGYGVNPRPSSTYGTSATQRLSSAYNLSSIAFPETRKSRVYGTPDSISSSLRSLQVSSGDDDDDIAETYLNPEKIRYTKTSIPAHFDNGHQLDSLKHKLKLKLVKPRQVPAVSIIKAYGLHFVIDGNRRLFVFKDVQKTCDNSLDLKATVDDDADQLIEHMRKDKPYLQVFDLIQMGQTIKVA